MAKRKGPKIEVPDELAAELDQTAVKPSEASLQGGDEEPTQPDGVTPEGDEQPERAADSEQSEGATGASPGELEELKDRYLRLAADFENYKRRALKERENLFNYGNESLIKELLETVDNLERALAHPQGPEEKVDAQTLLEGVELTHRSLMRALEKFGVQPVEADGQRFDPQVHEAVRQVESQEHPAGSVVEVYQKGYLLKDRLLRPAIVGVSSRPDRESD